MNFVFILLLVFQLTSCSDTNPEQQTNKNPQIISFSTDGKMFLFTIQRDDDVVELYTSEQDGVIRKPLSDTKLSRSFSHIGKTRIYYAEYTDELKSAVIISCNKFFKDCRTIVSMSGAIGNMVETQNGKLVFLRSDYVPETHKNSGYGHFSFYEFDPQTGKVDRLSKEVFARENPMISINNQIYFSAYFWGNHRPSDRSEYKLFGQGYTALWIDDQFQIIKNKLFKYDAKENGKILFDFVADGRLISYVLGSKSGGYGYYICIRENKKKFCYKELRNISYPVYSNGKIILAEIESIDTDKPQIKILFF